MARTTRRRTAKPPLSSTMSTPPIKKMDPMAPNDSQPNSPPTDISKYV